MGVLDLLDEVSTADAEIEKEPSGNGNGKAKATATVEPPVEVKKLIEKQRLLESQLKEQNAENEKLRAKLTVVDKLESAFAPKVKVEDDIAIPEDVAGEMFYDSKVNYKRTQKMIKDEVDKGVREATAPIVFDQRVRAAQSEILEDHDLILDGKRVNNWDDPDVQKKLAKQLNVLSNETKVNDPKRALLIAAHLAGVLKKRDASELPEYEDNRGVVRMSKEQQDTFEKKEKAAIRAAATKRLFQL